MTKEEIPLDEKGKIKAEFIPDLDEGLEPKEATLINKKELLEMKKDPDKTYYIKTMRGPKKILSDTLLRIPLIGELIIKRKVGQGYIIAEVTFANQHSMRFLVPTSSDTIEIKQDEAVRFFDISDLRSKPERYIKFEDGKPVVMFNWDYPKPLPIKPTMSERFDLDTYGVLIIRQRSKAGAKPIQEFLEQTKQDIKLIKIMSLVSAVSGVVFLAQMFGFIS